MENPLTPSQIDKLLDMLRAVLRKVNPFSKEAQDLIENHWEEVKTEVIGAAADALNGILERIHNIIIRTVKVNRSRSPEEMIRATNRTEYKDTSVVKIIPRDEGDDEVTVEFFQLGKFVSNNDLAIEYQKRGLTPDPYAQAAVNEADPAFADKYPNGTHWEKDGNWYYIAFYRHDGGRSVHVYRGYAWSGRWWFGGVRKSRTLGN